MSKEHAFRFAVRNRKGQHSQQWRIWTRHNDCYLGSRGVAHDFKASFHETGKCQVGLSSEIRKKLVAQPGWENESRFYDQWEVDTNLSAGSSIKLLELVIPNSQLDEFEEKTKSKVRWIHCEEGKAASIEVFKANMGAEQIASSLNIHAEELCRLPLSNGYYIVAWHRLVDEKLEYNKVISNTLNAIFPLREGRKTFINGEVNTASPSIRAMIGYKNQHGRYWFEASLRKTFVKGAQKGHTG